MTFPWLSPDALLKGWEHVHENHGCAGVDGITVDRFSRNLDEELDSLRARVEAAEYRSLPLLPITIQKKPGSSATRTLLVPAVRDRVLQTTVGRYLGRAFEDEFLDCSFAYRPHRSVNSAIARIRYLHDHGYKFVAEADIDAFFDRIDHVLLRERLATHVRDAAILDLVEGWIECFAWDGHRVRRVTAGVPQGSPISPLLANFFLSDFDLALEEAGLKVIRYADDFLILARRRDEATAALEIARDRLNEIHLELKDSKTTVASFEQGFRFLGALFLGSDVWIPWGRHDRNRHVLAVPRPMPRSLVEKWMRPRAMTVMGQAFRDARHRPMNGGHASPDSEEDEMAFLYLTEQGSVLRKIGDRLVVEKDDTILLDTPYHKLEAVLVFGNVQITTQAMAELLDASIPVSLLSREGHLRGSLQPPLGKNVPLRLAQFELHHDADRSLAIARRIIEAKIENASSVLASFGDRKQASSQETKAAIVQLREAREKARAAATLDILDGVEGAAARLYFTVLMRRNKSEFSWRGRVKHPSTDPVNALLSFGYTLVTNELAAVAETIGLDSYLGCLHQLDYGRQSLALDLVEPFRAPLVDRLVLTVLNRRQFEREDFEEGSGGGLYLKSGAAKRFLAEYERWTMHESPGGGREGFRMTLRDEVESYAAALREGDDGAFEPFLYQPGRDEGESAETADR
jgi:CRISPR-associated protein Cas1